MHLYKKNFIFKCLTIALLTIGNLFTLSATEITLKVDGLTKTTQRKKGEVYTAFLNESFGAYVTATTDGYTPKNVQINNLSNFHVLSKSTSTSFQLAGGRRSSSYTYHFELMPTKEGFFAFGPATATCNAQEASSNQVQIRVQPRPEARGVRRNAKSRGICFAELETSNKSPFIWETFKLVLRVYACEQKVIDVQVETPQFADFEIEKLSTTQKRVAVDHVPYSVIENTFALTPTKPGSKTLGPITINYRAQASANNDPFYDDFFHGFFGRMARGREATIRSQSIVTDVKSIPETTEQVDGIGIFSEFDLSLEKTRVFNGEPMVVKLKLTGIGNFSQIPAPNLDLPVFFKTYDSKTTFDQTAANRVLKSGTKEFEYILQIHKTGDFMIPTQKFTYFDTEKKVFKILKTKPVSIKITPREDGKTVSNIKQNVETTGKTSTKQITQKHKAGLVHSIAGYYSESAPSHKINFLIFLLLLILPYIIWLGSGLLTWWRGYNKTELVMAATLSALETCKKNHDLSQLHNIIIIFLAGHFGAKNKTSVTEDWIEQKLLKISLPPGKVDSFFLFLTECAGHNFGTQISHPSHKESSNLFNKTEEWIALLDKYSRKTGKDKR